MRRGISIITHSRLITIKSIQVHWQQIYFHLLWPPETGQHSTWIKWLQLSKRCCLPSTECSFTVDTESAVNSCQSATDGTSITVKVSPAAYRMSAFAESCSYLSALLQTVHDNCSLFTVQVAMRVLSIGKKKCNWYVLLYRIISIQGGGTETASRTIWMP